MKKRVLIFGAGGMLGRALKNALRGGGFQVRGLTHAQCDIADGRAVRRALNAFRPDVVVNSAAYTNVDLCEYEKRAARRANGLGPGILAKACKLQGVALVQVSTDSVFGDHARGRRETDKPDPINAYGRSKAAGEKAVRAAGGDWYIVRTSWLFGPGGRNFVDTILKKAGRLKELRVVDDQYGRPTYTLDLAVAITGLLKRRAPFGVYHVTNSGDCSWHALASEAVRQAGKKTRVLRVPSSYLRRAAKRPRHSHLINTKLRPERHWRAALKDYLKRR